MRLRFVVAFCLLLLPAFVHADERTLGTLRRAQGGGITVSIRSNDPYLNGPSLMCFDKHVIESVSFFGLTKAELVTLRGLIDQAIAEAR